MQKFTLTTVLLAMLAFCAAGSALAEDLNPPAWDRGAEGTTYARWEFLEWYTDPVPDEWSNPCFAPSMIIGTPSGWYADWGGRAGVWEAESIEVVIPNYVIDNPYKDIWIQVTWAGVEPCAAPPLWAVASGQQSIAEVVCETVLGPSGMDMPYDCWYHTTYKIHLEPNPACETLYLSLIHI